MKAIFFSFSFLIIAASAVEAHSWDCPPDFTDTGAHCLKPPTYGRGVGHTQRSHCEDHYGIGNCEKCLSLYYPLCRPNYEPKGCNVCSPKCPPNMTDIGVSCQK